MRYLGAVITMVAAVLLVAVGVAAVAYGEGDDSPGLQGIGGLVVLAVVVSGARHIVACRNTTADGTTTLDRGRSRILRR